jgi:hypothetical protein
MNELQIKLVFTESLLGMCSGNPELHREYIASKSKDAAKLDEEMKDLSASEIVAKTSTVFPRHDGWLFLWDYQIKGFIKEAIGVQVELGNIKGLSKWTYKRVIDSTVFIQPRRVVLYNASGDPLFEPDGMLQRPLRASTMQGDRVALASSEFVEAGASCHFTLKWLPSSNVKSAFYAIDEDVLESALRYGELKGCGQWRNGGHGTFQTTILGSKIAPRTRAKKEDAKACVGEAM